MMAEQDEDETPELGIPLETVATIADLLNALEDDDLDEDEDLDTEPIVGQRMIAVLVGMFFAGAVLAVIIVGKDAAVTGARSATEAISPSVSNIVQIGRQLFTTYVFPLELTAGLLTIAVVGAVVLSRRPKDLQPIPEPESMTELGDDPLTTTPGEAAH